MVNFGRGELIRHSNSHVTNTYFVNVSGSINKSDLICKDGSILRKFVTGTDNATNNPIIGMATSDKPSAEIGPVDVMIDPAKNISSANRKTVWANFQG
jgi:hypothetical protein